MGNLEFPYNQLLLPGQANGIDILKPVTAPRLIGTEGLSRVEGDQKQAGDNQGNREAKSLISKG